METNKKEKRKLTSFARVVATITKMIRMRPFSIIFGETKIKIQRAQFKHRVKRSKKKKIEFNRDRCMQNPLDCARCMKVCPEGVYFIYPRYRRAGKICETYELSRAFVSRCTGCGSCIAVCPHNALIFN